MGSYIALEGIEGAGKSTVAAAIVTRLRSGGHRVLQVREPGGTAAGEAIRSVLLHGSELEPWTEALLFAAQRAQLAAEVIRPALESGIWVVSDRTAFSSLAYQGVARGLGLEQVHGINDLALGGLWPARVILLELEPAIGLARQHDADRIGREGVLFQQAVGEAFASLARNDDRFVRIAADRPLEVVEEEAWLSIEDLL
jgi:dTMP kinase